MENPGLSKRTVSFGLALALASVTNGLLVIAKEKSPAIQAGMKRLTGHHWVTHSIIILGLFILSGCLFAQANGGRGVRMNALQLIITLVSGVAVGVLLIVGFYLIGD